EVEGFGGALVTGVHDVDLAVVRHHPADVGHLRGDARQVVGRAPVVPVLIVGYRDVDGVAHHEMNLGIAVVDEGTVDHQPVSRLSPGHVERVDRRDAGGR